MWTTPLPVHFFGTTSLLQNRLCMTEYALYSIYILSMYIIMLKSTEVLTPRCVSRTDIYTCIRADYMHAYNYTHGLRMCNGKVYGKLDVRQNGGFNHGKQITF